MKKKEYNIIGYFEEILKQQQKIIELLEKLDEEEYTKKRQKEVMDIMDKWDEDEVD